MRLWDILLPRKLRLRGSNTAWLRPGRKTVDYGWGRWSGSLDKLARLRVRDTKYESMRDEIREALF
jgi:hypothetical protein